MEDDLHGNVKLFSTGRGNCGGAERMIDAGVMKNPKVDAVFRLHVSPK